jgi:hypothetical protein
MKVVLLLMCIVTGNEVLGTSSGSASSILGSYKSVQECHLDLKRVLATDNNPKDHPGCTIGCYKKIAFNKKEE